MNDGTWEVRLVERAEIREFIEKWHYSRSINGVLSTYCFGLYRDSKMQGAMLFGKVGMANAWKKYADKQEEILELRRLCCVDDTPKNAESYFIGKCLKWIRRHSEVKLIVSYADTNHGHEGIIYRATNFSYMGTTSPGRVIIHGDRQYHDKTIRTKYKGELKPFAKKVKAALDNGEAYYKKTTPKHVYLMRIKPLKLRASLRDPSIQIQRKAS